MSVVIPSPGQVGSLFTIPASDWDAINTRVTVVIEVQSIAQEIVQYVPNYVALLGVCQQWKPQTYAGLLAEAYETSLFATQAANILTALSGDLKPLKAGDPLPDTIRFIFTVQFAALRDTAAQRSAAADLLTGEINAFVTQNRAADAAIQGDLSRLGPGWEEIEGVIGSLEHAMSDVQAGWTDVRSAFAAAASSEPDLTSAALLAADVQSVIAAWNRVSAAATSFDRTATSRASGR